MNLILLCIIVLSTITNTQCALLKECPSETRTLYTVTNGSLKDQDVTILISANKKWETDNIWANVNARNHPTVQSFFVSMIQELYPFNGPAQKELRLTYNQAHDILPLLATTKYDSKKYFLVHHYNKERKAYKEYLVPKEWLVEQKK